MASVNAICERAHGTGSTASTSHWPLSTESLPSTAGT